MTLVTRSEVKEIFSSLNAYKDNVHKSEVLLLYLITNMQCEDGASTIVSEINKMLENNGSRDQGLKYLNHILPSCSVTILNTNSIMWANICINQFPSKSITPTRFLILGKLIALCKSYQDFNKTVTTGLLPKIMQMCLTPRPNSKQLSEAVIFCIKNCVEVYPSTCGPFKSKLETLLLKCLDNSRCTTVTENAANAFVHLQQTGGAGENGIIHTQNWSQKFEKMCVTTHCLYDQFLQNVPDANDDDSIETQVTPFEYTPLPLTSSGKTDFAAIAQRINNILMYMKSMILEPYPVPKEIKLPTLLSIIKRGLATYHTTDLEYSVLLFQQQVSTLHLLHAVIACLRHNLLPYSFIITHLLIDCLNRTHKHDYFKTSSEYQSAVYKVLNYWIGIAKCGLDDTLHDKLVNLIVLDINPVKNSVMLNIQMDVIGKSAAAKQKAVKEKVIASGGGTGNFQHNSVVKSGMSSLDEEIKVQVCSAALTALSNLLQHVILRLKLQTQNILCETIVNGLLTVQTNNAYPYTNLRCQAALYKTFIHIFEQPLFAKQPSLALGINILNNGMKSKHNDIHSTCTKGLAVLELICQPVCPSLYISTNSPVKQNLEHTEQSPFAFMENLLNEEPTAPKQAPPASKRIKILDLHIIKGAETLLSFNENDISKTNAGSTTSLVNSDTEKYVKQKSKENISTKKIKEVKPTVLDKIATEVCSESTTEKKVNGDIDRENVETADKVDTSIVENNNVGCKTTEEEQTMQSVMDKSHIAREEPPTKKSKIEDENTLDLDYMMDSFVDIVNNE